MLYCAFVRALNVGRANRIRMEELRSLFAAGGAGDVRTYLQTGNVLFRDEGDGRRVGLSLEVDLAARGLRNASIAVRSLPELEALVAAGPFPIEPADAVRTVVFLRDVWPPGGEAAARAAEGVVAVRERELLLATASGQAANAAWSRLERKYGLQGTARYWHVVEQVTRQLAAASQA